MKFFLDTANVQEIKDMVPTGLIDGVTTNPSLIAASGRDIKEVISEICSIVDGPVSAEVTATDFDTMLAEGRMLQGIAKNITVKVPLTFDGLKTCKTLSDEGTSVNVTLCFSAAQALLAAKAGATYVSPFIGRIDDTGHDGMTLIAEIMETWSNYDLSTKVLAASIRHPTHVLQCIQLGAHTATMPAKIFRQLMKHPLTDKGIDGFMKDWAEVEAAGKA